MECIGVVYDFEGNFHRIFSENDNVVLLLNDPKPWDEELLPECVTMGMVDGRGRCFDLIVNGVLICRSVDCCILEGRKYEEIPHIFLEEE